MAYISLDVLIVILWLGFWGAAGGIFRFALDKKARKKTFNAYVRAGFEGAFIGIVVTVLLAKNAEALQAIVYAGVAGFGGPQMLYALVDVVLGALRRKGGSE